ncbi:hypothetical protein [Aureispira anguillae]|uniref:Uncharacterized protein n=1 Tax=Aureispira anguillae TaxID=2864201 RepID=A0A915YDI4_9BACT|nr:hypothetical protein [Aureispira anguillae]BDS11058.1 hypothetical protein AsAng_0017690 [Aureispira anguillae]
MQNHLYFICPTDNLETIIDYTFRGRNYYYTSLGNSIVFNNDTTWQIQKLINKNHINKISFILSNDNRIILDALGNQGFSKVTGLNNCYDEIIKQKKLSEKSWQRYKRQFSIISYHLNKKIKELRFGINGSFASQLKISGKIYHRQEQVFKDIYPDLICRESFSLN